MTQIDDYVPPSSSEGDRINPKELVDRVLVVQPLKLGDSTRASMPPAAASQGGGGMVPAHGACTCKQAGGQQQMPWA